MLGAATTATAATLKELFTDARAQTTKTKRNETKRTQKDDDDDAGDDAAAPRPPLTLAQVLRAERERESAKTLHSATARERRRRQTKQMKSCKKFAKTTTWRSVCMCV